MKYYNVDWVSDPIDRRSTTGYCNFVGVYLVTWRCKKQNVVARSSAEAEYKVMTHTACKLMWIQSLLCEMSIIYKKARVIYCDNQAAMYIINNHVFMSE